MATFTVTNLFNSGAGSLRNAIFQANTATTTDIIDFNPSLSGGTINLTSKELRIRDDLTINGLGSDLLGVDAGGNPFRVFNVDDGNSSNNLEVAIKGLTITGGNADFGSGIYNLENLTVTNSTISDNSASGKYSSSGIRSDGSLTVTNSRISGNVGSGIDFFSSYDGFYGDLTVSNSTISGNTESGIHAYLTFSDVTVSNSTISSNVGSGIDSYSSYGDLTVTSSTISGNTDTGIDFFSAPERFNLLTVTNSTISDNTTKGDGGGIDSSAYNLTMSNSTISGNTAKGDGGGIFNYDSNFTVTNSTISGNTAKEGDGIFINSNGYEGTTVTSSIIAANTNNEDIGGAPFTSGGNNLIGNGDGAAGFTNGINGDIVGTTANPIDPLLDELQDNGGPTQTQALLPGSPAINAGSNPQNLKFDQRGPGFNRVVGAQADIGAYEVVPEPDSTLGVLGVAVLGVILMRKCQQQQKTRA